MTTPTPQRPSRLAEVLAELADADNFDAAFARIVGDHDAFRDLVTAEARSEVPVEVAQALRWPEHLVAWRHMLAEVLADLQVQFAARTKRERNDKLTFDTAKLAHRRGNLDDVAFQEAVVEWDEARLAHADWRAKTSKFQYGMGLRHREARGLLADHLDAGRLRAAIKRHRQVTLDEYEATDADHALWREIG